MDAFLTYYPVVVLWLSITVMIMLGISVYFYGLDYTVRRFFRNQPWVSIPMVIVATYYGGAKFHPKVNIPLTDPDAQYIYDSGSYVTNDHAYISFSTLFLPDDADIIVAYAPDWASNETQVVTLDSMPLAQWKQINCRKRYDWDLDWGDRADEYRWYLYTTWAPAPAVHTNGVLNCYGIAVKTDQGSGRWEGVTKRTIVVKDRDIISPDDEFWDFEYELEEIQNAPVYGGEGRPPRELEEYFDINR